MEAEMKIASAPTYNHLMDAYKDREEALQELADILGVQEIDHWDTVLLVKFLKQDLEKLQSLVGFIIKTWKDENKGNIELYASLEKLDKYFGE